MDGHQSTAVIQAQLRGEPMVELGVQMPQVFELAGEEEVLAHVAKRALHLPLGLRPIRCAHARTEPVVRGHVEQRRVVADLTLIVFAEHDRLHPVVEHLARYACELREGRHVAAHHGLEVRTHHEAPEQIPAVPEHHREQPHHLHLLGLLGLLGEHHLELREIHLRLLAGRRLEPMLEPRRLARAYRRDEVRHCGTSSLIPQIANLTQQPHRAELRALRQPPPQVGAIRIEFLRPWRPRPVPGLLYAVLQVPAYGLAVHTHAPSDLADRQSLFSELMDHEYSLEPEHLGPPLPEHGRHRPSALIDGQPAPHRVGCSRITEGGEFTSALLGSFHPELTQYATVDPPLPRRDTGLQKLDGHRLCR